ncbi:MAG TPA: winged helix-turn-helix domain-containing protein [Acidobacteriota bacterium]
MPSTEIEQTAPARFRLRGVEVQVELNRLITPAGELRLEPKIMQVLACLAARPGALVTKAELLEQVWNGTFVTEDVLTRAVGELRKAFGDDPNRPAVIETIRTRGYRLIAPVERAATASAPAAWAPSQSVQKRRQRWLAVAAAAAAVLVAIAWWRFFGLRGARPAMIGADAPRAVRVVPFTSLPGNERDPAIAPDGSRVAFAWNGGAGDEYRIYVRLRDAEQPLRISGGPGRDRAPVWSPDGQHIAFVRLSGERCELHAVPSIGGVERRIASCDDSLSARFAWSPDGERLAVSARRGARAAAGLELVAFDGSERRPLTVPPPQILGDTDPAFSPPGDAVAFVRNLADGVGDVHVAALGGGATRRLTYDHADIQGVTWSRDGRWIVFSSNRAGIYSLWKLPAGGGAVQWLAGGGTKIKHPSAARGENLLAYENWIYDVNLWEVPLSDRADAAGTESRQLTATSDEWNFAPAYSPDGMRIAFASTRSGSEEIWVMQRDGSQAARLTSFGGGQLGAPSWSPDGQKLVFSARPQGEADLYVLDVAGGAARRLTRDPGDEVAASWSQDGRSVLFASRRSESWQIWRMPAVGGAAVQVTRRGGYLAAESPDGRWLYVGGPEAAGIRRLPVEGGPEIAVSEAIDASDCRDWRIGRTGIYFKAGWDGDRMRIRFAPFDGGAPRDVARLSHAAWSGFAVAPDGQSLIYARSDRYTSDIRLIENAL